MTSSRQVVDPVHLNDIRDCEIVVMATLQPDGRPQLSLVRPWVHDSTIEVSLTQRRIKTRNLRLDPRVALLAARPSGERFVVAQGHASLTEVSSEPGDDTGRQLADLYRAIAGEHPDWDDYFQAMVDEQRLIARIDVKSTYDGGTHT